MKFLIQGIGSIGQRHYRNVRALGHEAAILRSSNAQRPFVQKFFEEERASGDEPVVFYDLEEAMRDYKPAAIVIATPNHLHCQDSLAAARHDLHLFIEKPAAVHAEELRELQKEVEDRDLVTMVGYNLRFHPLLVRAKEIVDSGELGNVLSAAVEVGEDIRDWHPWEEYTDTYAPFVRSGGGSVLCFSHDIDYLQWILGIPTSVYSGGGKVTPLEGDAEDLVQSLWKYEDSRVATIHIDYWQRPKVRTLKIVGSKKTLLWDAYADLSVWDHETSDLQTESMLEGFARNSMFLDEMKHFIDCVADRRQTAIPLSAGVAAVALADRIKDSLAHI